MKVFISYEYGDKKYRNDVKSIVENPNTHIPHNSIHETKNFKQQGQKKINNYISSLIRDVGAVLCLIGNNTHNAQGVLREIDTANNWNIPIISVRIPKTTGPIPNKIKIKKIISLNPNEILDALNHSNQWL